MKEIKAVVDAYPCDGDMAKKPNSILFQLGGDIAIGERRQTELTMVLMQISVALDETNASEMFWMCASSNMAVFAIEMTKLEVNGKR